MPDKLYTKSCEGYTVDVVVSKGRTTGYLHMDNHVQCVTLCTVYGEYDADQYMRLEDVAVSVETYLYGLQIQMTDLAQLGIDVASAWRELKR